MWIINKEKKKDNILPYIVDYWDMQVTVFWIGITDMILFFTILYWLDNGIQRRNISFWGILVILLGLIGTKFSIIFISLIKMMRGVSIKKNMFLIVVYLGAIAVCFHLKMSPIKGYACCSAGFILITVLICIKRYYSFHAIMERKYPDLMYQYRMYDTSDKDKYLFLETNLCEILKNNQRSETADAIKGRNEVYSLILWNFEIMVFTCLFLIAGRYLS